MVQSIATATVAAEAKTDMRTVLEAEVVFSSTRRVGGAREAWMHRASATRLAPTPYAQSEPPLRLCLPGKSTSGCTTRMCRVRASLRENVFSSTQSAQRTFCLRALWMVSS